MVTSGGVLPALTVTESVSVALFSSVARSVTL